MRQCPACGKWFRNKQAIRQHLRWCRIYRARKNDARMVRCLQCGHLAEITDDAPFECQSCGYLGFFEP